MRIVALTIPMLLLGGCVAALIDGRTQPLQIASTPSGAAVRVTGEDAVLGTTPCTIMMKRGTSRTLTLTVPGHKPYVLELSAKASQRFWIGNGLLLLITCTPGTSGTTTDLSLGTAYEYAPDAYHVDLRHVGARPAHSVLLGDAGSTEARLARSVLAWHADILQELATGDAGEHTIALRELTQTTLSLADFCEVLRFLADLDAQRERFAEAVAAIPWS